MTGELRRTLGTPQAVVVGLAAMMGAGVFYVWAPAAAAAGTGLLIGLLIAAVVATLNALSTTQLAMAHPVSGGAYAYGRHTIGPRIGFTAGWLFMVGKISSAGAIALIAGSYLAPDYARLIAVLAVVVLAAINATGIRSTSRVSTLIVGTVLGGLLLIIVTTLIRLPTLQLQPLGGTLDIGANGWLGILQSAGLLFFSFAGYARMATLGEEVLDPRKTLPRAIIIALAITLLIYGTIAILCVTVLGIPALAQSTSPVADLVSDGWDTVIRTIAAIACLGSLMGVLAGLSRTGLAMSRNKDLPG
ncbi:MAG TPA: APC family permease, partial [Glaciihabitans sp.]|nr:APC family permease [Glaciihabitans sp.]